MLSFVQQPVLSQQAVGCVRSVLDSSDVASIKTNTSGRAGYDGFKVVHGNLTVRNVSLRMLIERAYEMQGAPILGGPAWAGSDRYDVVAKGPASATKEQVWLMLRSLLADRFKVEVRNEIKELPMYALEVGKGGPKLPKRDGDCVPDADPASRLFVPPCGGAARVWGPQGGVMIGQKMSMPGIASGLSGIVDRPVVDRTGLKGAFDLELRWTPDGYQFVAGNNEERTSARPAEAGPPLLAAIQEQLGLKLVATKGPVDVLVIVHADKPSEN